jgi:hypothetical protein
LNFFIKFFLFCTLTCFWHKAVSAEDKLCSELLDFINSVKLTESHSIYFVSNWSEMRKTCKHGSSEPGKRLCYWLGENASGEFMEKNVNRTMSCLGSPNYLSAENSMMSNASGSLIVVKADGVKKDIIVEIEYSVRESAESSLTITADNK